jgi:hypothetical protein
MSKYAPERVKTYTGPEPLRHGPPLRCTPERFGENLQISHLTNGGVVVDLSRSELQNSVGAGVRLASRRGGVRRPRLLPPPRPKPHLSYLRGASWDTQKCDSSRPQCQYCALRDLECVYSKSPAHQVKESVDKDLAAPNAFRDLGALLRNVSGTQVRPGRNFGLPSAAYSST